MKWNEICIKELFLSLRLLEMQILFSRKHKQNWAYKTMNSWKYLEQAGLNNELT